MPPVAPVILDLSINIILFHPHDRVVLHQYQRLLLHNNLLKCLSLVQEVCLHGVVSMTHDSAVLLSVLRQLSGSQAVALGQYLMKLMTKYSGKPGST